MPGRKGGQTTSTRQASPPATSAQNAVLAKRDQLMQDRRNQATLRKGGDDTRQRLHDEALLKHRNELMRQHREAELLRKRDSLMHRQGTR